MVEMIIATTEAEGFTALYPMSHQQHEPMTSNRLPEPWKVASFKIGFVRLIFEELIYYFLS